MNIKKLNEELKKVLNEPITEISVGSVSKVRDARRARENELKDEISRLTGELWNTREKADKADKYIHKKNMIPVNQVKDEISKILRDKPSDPNTPKKMKKDWGRSKFFNIEFTYNDKAFNWIILVDSKSYKGERHNIIALRSKDKDQIKYDSYHGNTVWSPVHSIVSDTEDVGLWNAALQAVKKYFNVNENLSRIVEEAEEYKEYNFTFVKYYQGKITIDAIDFEGQYEEWQNEEDDEEMENVIDIAKDEQIKGDIEKLEGKSIDYVDLIDFDYDESDMAGSFTLGIFFDETL